LIHLIFAADMTIADKALKIDFAVFENVNLPTLSRHGDFD
jgi:hypothetical protein